MQSSLDIPQRVVREQEARQLFPAELALLVPALSRSDPLADAAITSLAALSAGEVHRLIASAVEGNHSVPDSLHALVEDCRRIPAWVNWQRIDRAGELFFRAGVLGGITLGMCSLIYGYASPVGNKPLAFSGALEKKAQRRLAETSKFVAAVCAKGGLRPGAPGFGYSVHVRLMHAQVRAMALRDERWDDAKWGLPINQHDMLATILLFSVVFVDGLHRLGVHATPQEQEDFQHLWRLVGFYLGVEADLLPRTMAEARRHADFIRLTQGAPDDDSRALVDALVGEPLRRAKTPGQRRVARAHTAMVRILCRALLDEQTAQGLGFGGGGAEPFLSRLHSLMQVLEGIRKRIRPLDAWVTRFGRRYWDYNSHVLGAEQSVFVIPEALLGRSRA